MPKIGRKIVIVLCYKLPSNNRVARHHGKKGKGLIGRLWLIVNFHSNHENYFAVNVFGRSILNQINLANKVPQKVTFTR